MGSEARSGRQQSDRPDLSSISRAGNTRPPDSSFAAAGSYELHVLRQKENIESISHDESDESDRPFDPSPHPNSQNMSRVPLLVRSSPALGTGSYGGLPVLVSSSPDDSEDHHVINRRTQSSKRKGKSKLRHDQPSQRRSSLNQSQADSLRSKPVSTTSRARRRSTREESGTSALLGNAYEGYEESGQESRRVTSGLAALAIGASRVVENLQSTSTSSQTDSDGEDEDLSESDDLHDNKDSGYPPDNSPYANVRASVATTDDLSLSINTPRMWVLSILFAILGSSTNLFFSLRYPSVSITPIIALLLVHPLGLLWDQLLKRSADPEEYFLNGVLQSENSSIHSGSRPTSRHSAHLSQSKLSRRTRARRWLAQGRWNAKEHCCVYISSNVSFGFAFATDVCPTSPQKDQANVHLGHCRTNEILQSGSRCCLSNTTHAIYSDSWICARWTYPSISSPAQWHGLAHHTRVHFHVCYVTQRRE
jgi:hypothetical protein